MSETPQCKLKNYFLRYPYVSSLIENYVALCDFLPLETAKPYENNKKLCNQSYQNNEFL